MKHIVVNVSLAVTLLWSTSYAQNIEPTAPANFNGFYAGVRGGLANGLADLNSTSSASYNTAYGVDTTTNRTTAKAYSANVIGAIAAGYGRTFGIFYLATEAALNLTDSQAGHTDDVETTDPSDERYIVTLDNKLDAKLNSLEFAIDFKPGILLTPRTLLYFKTGLAFNEIRFHANSVFTYVNTTPRSASHSTAIIAAKATKHTEALRLGAGIQTLLSKKLALDVDYTYTYYGRVRAGGVTTTNTGGGEVSPSPQPMSQTSSTKVRRQTFTMGLSYFF